ncbi:substrate-binding domain-containing protein [Pseudomonas frederiksbergensis]|uniref:substrate-binding domain-containing protein n=1 Tax=Pseudomonas frederiksbergensis TaxID=104087 RepID=UPI002182041F|nr:substrate-binding domain-containing protein [Pseudomonas frederiksbergensis]
MARLNEQRNHGLPHAPDTYKSNIHVKPLFVEGSSVRGDGVATGGSRTVQAQMCSRGLGVAVLPRALGDQLSSLKLVDVGNAPPGRDIWMGYHHDMRHMDRLRALADLAGEMIGTQITGESPPSTRKLTPVM